MVPFFFGLNVSSPPALRRYLHSRFEDLVGTPLLPLLADDVATMDPKLAKATTRLRMAGCKVVRQPMGGTSAGLD